MPTSFFNTIFTTFHNLVDYGSALWDTLTQPVGDWIANSNIPTFIKVTSPGLLLIEKTFGNLTILELLLGAGLSIVVITKLLKLLLDAVPVA